MNKEEIKEKVLDLLLLSKIDKLGTQDNEKDIQYLETKYGISLSSEEEIWIKTIFGEYIND